MILGGQVVPGRGAPVECGAGPSPMAGLLLPPVCLMSRSETPSQLTTTQWLMAVLAVGLIFRLCLLAATVSLEARIVDEQHYLTLARNIVEGRGFAFSNGPTSLRPPAYPALIAAVWTVVGHESLQAVRALQAVLGVLAGLLAYRIACALFDEVTGVWAAGLTMFYPAFVIAQALLLTETLFACLVLGTVASVVSLLRRPRLATALCAGVLLGFAALTRSILYPFPVVLVPLLLWWTPASFGRRFVLGAMLCVGFAGVVTPWAIRNTQLQGVPVLVDTMGGLNLRMGNYEYTPHDRIWDAVSQDGDRSWIVGLPEQPPDGGAWTEGKKERWARQQALAFITSHPGLTLWRAVIKFGDFWALDRDFLAGVQRGLYHPPAFVTAVLGSALILAYPVALGLAVLGAWLVSPRDARGAAVLLILIAFVCALHTIVFAHPRYRLPLMPLVLVFTAAALKQQAWRLLEPRTWRGRGALLTLAGIAAIWVVQIAWRDWPAVRPLVLGAGS